MGKLTHSRLRGFRTNVADPPTKLGGDSDGGAHGKMCISIKLLNLCVTSRSTRDRSSYLVSPCDVPKVVLRDSAATKMLQVNSLCKDFLLLLPFSYTANQKVPSQVFSAKYL